MKRKRLQPEVVDIGTVLLPTAVSAEQAFVGSDGYDVYVGRKMVSEHLSRAEAVKAAHAVVAAKVARRMQN